MLDAPLYNAILQHNDLHRSSLHMPGHKNAAEACFGNLYDFDITELPDTDSLFEASGAILEAEQKAAELFGTKRALFSAGGSTLCIQAMLRLACQKSRKVVCGRVVHRSAMNTMALLGLTPVWVLPEPDAGDGFPGRVTAKGVAEALKECPEADAVYITSPDYYGLLADIPSIAAVCKQYNIPLLVDCAHGAHLSFTSEGHPIHQGAAMAACSAHKTLPALTGAAWLFLADEQYAGEAKQAMALFGSTSPSYPIMVSLDVCRAWLAENGASAFSALADKVHDLKQTAQFLGFGLPQGRTDPVRLTLRTADIGRTGIEAAQFLRQNGIEPEYADSALVILIPTPMNTPEDFKRLADTLEKLPKKEPVPVKCALPPLPRMEVSPREALFAPAETVSLESAVSRIAAETACPCPPGIPVVMPGEIISHAAAEFLAGYGILSIKVLK